MTEKMMMMIVQLENVAKIQQVKHSIIKRFGDVPGDVFTPSTR